MDLGKKILVLVFLLVVLIGVFLIQGDDFGKGYFSWLKTKMIGMGPELNLTEKDSGLDFTKIDIDNLSKKETASEKSYEEVMEDGGLENIDTIIREDLIIEEVEEVEEIEEEELTGIGGPIPGTEEAMSLAEIESEIIRIQTEVERLTIEIQNLTNNNL